MTVETVAGLFVGEGYFGIAVRKQRANASHGITLVPVSTVAMNDVLAIEEVSRFLHEKEIAHYLWRGNARGKEHLSLRIHGLKRNGRFLPWVLPYLFGAKRECAQNLADYTYYRLSLPHQAPITEKDLEFVRIGRSLNGGQGAQKTSDIDELSRILRD